MGIGIGHVIWSTKRRHTGGGSHGMPFGGIVVNTYENVDTQTGDLTRYFVVFDHYHGAYLRRFILTADEVDSETAQKAPDHLVVACWRRLAREIAETTRYKSRKGKPDPVEVWCCQAIANLQSLIFGPEGVLHAELEPLVATGPAPRPSYPVHPGLVDD